MEIQTQAGDIHFIDNLTILHRRKGFIDTACSCEKGSASHTPSVDSDGTFLHPGHSYQRHENPACRRWPRCAAGSLATRRWSIARFLTKWMSPIVWKMARQMMKRVGARPSWRL
ncbi:hypothetical protein V8F33_010455, partial [Rhypophila sp. PSN 637]